MDKTCISIVAAMGKKNELGKGNQLLWHIPDDLKRFKALTVGHPVIMGRKTFESIVSTLGKPLPERTNVVITTDKSYAPTDVVVAHGVEDGITKAKELGSEEIFIIGGAQIYTQTLPYAERLYLTLIEDSKDADAFFPAYEHLFTKKIKEEAREWNGLKYRWVDLEK